MKLPPLSRPRVLTILAAAALCAPLAASAVDVEFPAASPLETIKQRVGVTDIDIVYSRPSKNSRKIFGGLVPYGAVWRTGANKATTISFTDDVQLGGKPVPAGKYALFTIPKADEWTIILSKKSDQWGAYGYKEADDLVRFTVKPVMLPLSVETFTIFTGELKESSATIDLIWDNTAVGIPLTVDTAGNVQAAIKKATTASEALTPKFYASAASYYLNHNLDPKQALEWIDNAVKEDADNFMLIERKARIEQKVGDKAAALASAQKALSLAKASKEPVDESEIKGLEELVESLR